MHVHRALVASACTLTLIFASAACAPRVSKRAPAPHPDYAYLSKVQEPAASVSPSPVEPAPAPAPERAPIAVAAPVERPRPPPPPVAARDEEPRDEEPAPVSVARPPPAKSNFYAFSDSEIARLRKRSGDFRRMHDQLKQCTAKSEREIQRREHVRDEIIRLQNEELRTPRQEKQLAQLRAEERKLKQSRGQDSGECQKLEVRLTEMLKTHYPGGDDTSGARH